MSADLVIRGGTVLDGTGQPGRAADVAITDGRISAIGPRLSGREVLDAAGQFVAPGFIDIHTHYDAQVFWDPALTPSCHHGVTSVVAGNCGFTIAPTRPGDRDLIARTLEKVEDMDVAALTAGIPWDFESFPEYLASVETRGSVLNFASYVGHTALRVFVMGDDASTRAATVDEVATMERIVGEAIDAGAAGFATSVAPTHNGAGGLPVPSRMAELSELEALFAVVGQRRRGIVAITLGQAISADNMYEMQMRAGAPFTYTALLTHPNGWHVKMAEANEAGWQRGAQVWPQVSPRPLIFTFHLREPFMLNMNPVFAALSSGSVDERAAAYADPAWRQQALDGFAGRMQPRWETYLVAESARADLIGRRIVDLAAEAECTPLDALLDTALAENLDTRFASTIANDDVEGVRYLLNQDHCTIGLSDAGAHVGQLCDAPQATDLLGRWVRDREVMPVEKAVRKLSAVQADLYGFADRGYLREGAWGDVVVFDLDTIDPGPVRRVRDFPADSERLTADQPSGVTHVMVNGAVIRRDGEASLPEPGRRGPGQILRPAIR